MSIESAILLTIVALGVGYLLYALIHPDRF
ncbi:potassium-transporting ATPase subunit F [Solicola gregarius]|uniref:Potassium-transporting ATPase subunit F n=1 Tax=Solicola gregarius TaxID=2908642 RepID=A0AA46TGX0_9ACTN|nr:potassium-transporting ATPase subunit F [Solicola gregarius]UYM04592.1 potassium-transporting ATPase subunit F [Solicola gregarius]